MLAIELSSDGWVEFSCDAPLSVAAATAAVANGQVYVGSILFFPDSGNHCRQLYFNNLDGQFSDKGAVDCTRAAYESTKDAPKNWSVARTEVIAKGFH